MRPLLAALSWRKALLVGSEGALLVVAVAAAAQLRLSFPSWDAFVESGVLPRAVFVAAVVQACLFFGELYDLHAVVDRSERLIRSIRALGIASLLLALVYFWVPSLIVGRGVFLIAVTTIVPLVVVVRLAFEWFARSVGPRQRLLVVGAGPAAVSLARELHQRPDLGVRVVGFVDVDASRVGESLLNPGIVGTIGDIPDITRSLMVDRVVVSLGDARGRLPMDDLLAMKLSGMRFDHLASVYEEFTGKIAVENLRPSWLIFSEGFRKSVFQRAVKRVIDVAVALALGVLSAPVLGLVALVVRATSEGPVLYRQSRVGLNGRLFTIHKFRSMRVDAEAATGAVWAGRNDPRITPVGRFLRRTRLDELPQLWNVLKGDMSLVGPRPERPEFVERLKQDIPFYGQRHVVKPGLTGWAQVRYTYGANVEDALEKLQYDLYYIKHMSLFFDALILLETVRTVLLSKGA